MSKNSTADKDTNPKKKPEQKLVWRKEGTASWYCTTLPADLQAEYKPHEKTKAPSIVGEVTEASE